MREFVGVIAWILVIAFLIALLNPEKAAREFGRAIHTFRSEVAGTADSGAP